MSKYSWSDYCGTQDPRQVIEQRGKSHLEAYGFTYGLVKQRTEDDAHVELFEFGKSNGFYLVVEAKTAEQAGFLLRKFLKNAVLYYLGLSEERQPKLELIGVDEKWTT